MVSYDHLLECGDSVHAFIVYPLTALENCTSTQETMMKTLNQTLRSILLALTFIGTATTALAYDFEVDGIYYNINGDEVSVTYHDYSRIQVTSSSGTYWFENHYNYYAGYSNQVIIPETVTYNNMTYCVTIIGEHAFEECRGITSVIIPNTITVIENDVFYGCYSLRSVTCMALTPPSCSSLSNYSATLYIPLESLELYKSASAWNRFSNIIGFGQNTFSMADYTSLYGDTIVIPVTMENVDVITGFQTDLYLPDGFELLKDGDDYMVELSNRKGRDHVIMASDAPDGAVRVLSYSPTLKTYSGNEGELFYFTIKVPTDGSGIATYPIWLRKTLLTTSDEEEVGALETLSNVAVYFYILGDVDHSGFITVADIVLTAKYILYQNPEPFIFDAADINSDGNITITDVVKIAHLVLDADYGEPTKRLASSGSSGDNMSGEMSQQAVAISLENEQSYTAFQLDLTLPEGMTASGFALAERAKDLGLIVKDRGNGKMRVLGYTADLKTIKGSDGALLTFDVEGAGEILVDNIQLVTPEGQTVLLDGFAIGANTMTSVNELNASKTVARVDYFNLTGQRIDLPENGVTLVVTTYTDGTRTTAKIFR